MHPVVLTPALRRRRWAIPGYYLLFRDRRRRLPIRASAPAAGYPSCWRRRNAGTSSGEGPSSPSIT
jgi:hypothetical protein